MGVPGDRVRNEDGDVRGGLDDALDKLARRDELRRRAAGETPGTPPAVTELVEAIAGVISRHPELAVTVGVEGAGDPVLLHFGFADGVVQVSADNTVAARAAETTPRHVDIDIDLDIDVDPEPTYEVTPVHEAGPAYPAEPPRGSHDDQDRFGPTDYDYAVHDHAEPPTAERPFVAPAQDPHAHRPAATPDDRDDRRRHSGVAYAEPVPHPFAATPPPPVPPQTPMGYGSAPGHGGPPYSPPAFPAAAEPAYAPPAPPFPATPEPAYAPPAHRRPQPEASPGAQAAPQPGFAPAGFEPAPQPTGFTAPVPQPTGFIQPAPQTAPPFAARPTSPPAPQPTSPQAPQSTSPQGLRPTSPAAPRPTSPAAPHPASAPAPRPGFPQPLATPIPLRVERPEETEQAARRLAALLRDDPTLLDAPHDA